MRNLISLCTIVGLITGCHTPTHERVFMRQSAAESPETKSVKFSGQYRLYTNAQRFPTTQIATPLLEARLGKGDLLGFASSTTGHLLAVIGSDQKPIPNSAAATSFTWTMQPDPGQLDDDRTAVLMLTVIAVGFMIGIGLAATIPAPFGPFN